MKEVDRYMQRRKRRMNERKEKNGNEWANEEKERWSKKSDWRKN